MNKIEEDNNENNSQGNTSNTDSPNENNKRSKRTRNKTESPNGLAIYDGVVVIQQHDKVVRTCNRVSKAEKFSEERNQLIKELEKKMGLTEENRGVLLYDLEHNEELKEYLKNKIPEIRKLYKCGTWNYFVKQHTKEGEELSEIGLLKSIFKSEKYELISKRIIAERASEKKQYNVIYFFKDLNINQYFK
jgi:hypothetical protein